MKIVSQVIWRSNFRSRSLVGQLKVKGIWKGNSKVTWISAKGQGRISRSMSLEGTHLKFKVTWRSTQGQYHLKVRFQAQGHLKVSSRLKVKVIWRTLTYNHDLDPDLWPWPDHLPLNLTVMVLWSMRSSFRREIILFPVELLGEMGVPPCVISTRDSLLFRMRFSRLFFVYLQ